MGTTAGREPSVFGTRVLVRLNQMGWSQRDLAERLAVTPQSISQLLRRPTPYKETVERVAVALQVTPGDLDVRFKTVRTRRGKHKRA